MNIDSTTSMRSSEPIFECHMAGVPVNLVIVEVLEWTKEDKQKPKVLICKDEASGTPYQVRGSMLVKTGRVMSRERYDEITGGAKEVQAAS